MYSVRQRISTVMQPRGGYLEPRLFTSVKLPDDNIDIMVRGEDSRLTGLAVDYLTRFVAGQSALDAFAISLQGASCVQQETLARQLIATLDRQLDNRPSSMPIVCAVTMWHIGSRRCSFARLTPLK